MRGTLLIAMLGVLVVLSFATGQASRANPGPSPVVQLAQATTSQLQDVVRFAHDDDGRPVPQADYDRAAKAALDAVGGGRVHDVDHDNENGAAWEVEVTSNDGRALDVLLDANFKVVDISGESDSNEPGSMSSHGSHGDDDNDDDDRWDDD
jgi:hypothetical protein